MTGLRRASSWPTTCPIFMTSVPDPEGRLTSSTVPSTRRSRGRHPPPGARSSMSRAILSLPSWMLPQRAPLRIRNRNAAPKHLGRESVLEFHDHEEQDNDLADDP